MSQTWDTCESYKRAIQEQDWQRRLSVYAREDMQLGELESAMRYQRQAASHAKWARRYMECVSEYKARGYVLWGE